MQSLSYILIVIPNKKAKCLGIKRSLKLDISRLLKDIVLPEYDLYIFTPSWIEKLPKSGLISLSKEFTEFNIEYRLQFLPKSYPKYIFRFYPKSDFNVPLSIWNIQLMNNDNHTPNDLLLSFKKTFCCSFNSMKFEPSEINLNKSILSQRNIIKNNKVYLNIFMNEESAKDAKKRKEILHEIIATEKVYVNDLKNVTENLTEQFFIDNNIDPDIYRRTIKSIFDILPLHHKFLQTLEGNGYGIESSIGGCFNEYMQFFKVAVPHVANYSSANQELGNLIQTNKQFRKLITQICENYFDGKSVESLLVTPVQRIPRYPLLLRDLLKATCSNHWDYHDVSVAYENIVNLVQEIDKKTFEKKSMDVINGLQKQFGDNYNVLSIGRQLICSYEATTFFNNECITIYLFNDLLLCKNQDKFIEFQLVNTRFKKEDSTTFFDHKNKLTIQDFDDIDQFLEKFTETKKQYLTRKCSFEGTLQWVKDTNAKLPNLCSPSMTSICEDIYLFGGKKENGLPTNELWYFHNNKWILLQTKNTPRPRYDCSLNSFPNHLILYGGQDGINVFSDLIVLDIKTLTWEEIKNNINKPEGRFAHASCVSEDQIWIFGGKNNTKYFNDFFCYDFSINKWSKIITQKAPEPRAWHSAFWITDRKTKNLYFTIFGGAYKCAYNDIWLFDYDNANWFQVATIGDQPTARYAQTSIIFNNKLYIIGGKNMIDGNMDPYKLDLDKKPFEWSIIPQIDAPNTFSFGAGISIDKFGLILYSNALYNIRLSFDTTNVSGKRNKDTYISPIKETPITYPKYNPSTNMVSISFKPCNNEFDYNYPFIQEDFDKIIDKDKNGHIRWHREQLILNCDDKCEDKTDGDILYLGSSAFLDNSQKQENDENQMKPTSLESTTSTKPTSLESTTSTKPTSLESTTITKPKPLESTTSTKPKPLESTTITKPTSLESTTSTKRTSLESTTIIKPTSFESTKSTKSPLANNKLQPRPQTLKTQQNDNMPAKRTTSNYSPENQPENMTLKEKVAYFQTKNK